MEKWMMKKLSWLNLSSKPSTNASCSSIKSEMHSSIAKWEYLWYKSSQNNLFMTLMNIEWIFSQDYKIKCESLWDDVNKKTSNRFFFAGKCKAFFKGNSWGWFTTLQVTRISTRPFLRNWNPRRWQIVALMEFKNEKKIILVVSFALNN